MSWTIERLGRAAVVITGAGLDQHRRMSCEVGAQGVDHLVAR